MKNNFLKFGFFFIQPIIKFYWFLFRPTTTGVKCILHYGDEVLLIRNSYGLKLWTLPGGGVKQGESLEEAVIREVKEEVGVNIQNPRKCGSTFYDGEYKKNTIWVFAADTSSRQFDIDGNEVAEARWHNPTTLPPKKSHLLKTFLELEVGS